MKTSIPQIALLAVAGILYTSVASAQGKGLSENNEKKVTLKIQVSGSHSNLSEVSVKIYDDQKNIKVLHNTNKRNMKVELVSNSYYIIEVCSPGYITKSILVSTVIPKDTLNDEATPYEHKISILLDKNFSSQGRKTIKNIPLIGIVFYDQNQDDFLGCPLVNQSPNKKEIIAQLENWFDSSTGFTSISEKANTDCTDELLLVSQRYNEFNYSTITCLMHSSSLLSVRLVFKDM